MLRVLRTLTITTSLRGGSHEVDVAKISARNAAVSAGLNSHIRGEIHQAAIIIPATLQRVLAMRRGGAGSRTTACMRYLVYVLSCSPRLCTGTILRLAL